MIASTLQRPQSALRTNKMGCYYGSLVKGALFWSEGRKWSCSSTLKGGPVFRSYILRFVADGSTEYAARSESRYDRYIGR